ncbi:MAG: hypothetical protein NUV86_02915 [Candidatus Scalindua sp.]|nr:hypothetical protein [Candidatus Scalindua sp.]MCR4344043.1 hypothetical protein [Candidatus Scalindua sp.]
MWTITKSIRWRCVFFQLAIYDRNVIANIDSKARIIESKMEGLIWV